VFSVPRSTVTVKIPGRETIYTLKETIKDKKKHAFKDVDAADLILWKVSINSHNLQETELFPNEEEALESGSSFQWLTTIFCPPPVPGHLHVIVKVTQLLSLSCFILGDDRDLDHVLVIKVRTTETVSELKDLIKGKRSIQLADVDATTWNSGASFLPLTTLLQSSPQRLDRS
jgi:hypothetical protein